jgi:exopolyphosphatase/guanosine-5'-triphosphate,3'-diphosphate pyrophosphatase
MRIAAIDIGTNSIHMIVVQVRPDLSFEIIDREKDMIRLGAGGLDKGTLTETAVTAALQVLAKYRRLAESHKVDEIVASATSAVREAENGGEFITLVARQIGIHVRVISGTEEARLIHLAAAYGVDLKGSTAAVIDIGGGSVEVTLGGAGRPQLARSFKMGVIRLTERFVKSDPLGGRDERRIVKHISRETGEYLDEIASRGFDRVIGTSGTILSLGTLAAEARPSADVRNLRVAGKAIHRLRKRLVGLELERRLRFPGLDPRRADLSVAGVVLLDTLLRRLGAQELTLCDLALREGLVLDYIRRNAAHIRKVERYPDVRRRSIVELGERCQYWSEHPKQVARIALSLFDQTRHLHRLTDREREWLEYGALLHDIGVHISYERHHRHSYYLIKNGDLRGFDPSEIEIVGLVARYHRRGAPKKSHDDYAQLPGALRRTVKVLAAFVRLAEGLDRSHAQTIAAVDVRERKGSLVVRLRASGDAELELWAAERHAAPLAEALERPVRFEVTSARRKELARHAQHARHAARVPRQTLRGRRDRRVRQDHAARPAREVAERRGTPRVRHRMELVGAGQGGHQGGQKKERPDADDLQPVARHRLR